MKKMKKITAILSLALCLIMISNTNVSAAVTKKKGWHAASYGTTYTFTGKHATEMYKVLLNGTFDGFVMEFNNACNSFPVSKAHPLYWTYKAEFTILKKAAKTQKKITPNKLKIHLATLPLPGIYLVPMKK